MPGGQAQGDHSAQRQPGHVGGYRATGVDNPKALVDKVEQVARLIRSKGVGVYFVTQDPDDIPGDILGQLGNRVQHALRAFTARDRKALRQAAETYRPNPAFDTETAIREVGTGEAVTSMLQKKGVPGIVQRTLIRPPSSQLGPITVAERKDALAASPLAGKYDTAIDRHSAYEMLKARATAAAEAAETAERTPAKPDREHSHARRYEPSPRRETPRSRRTRYGAPQSVGEALGQAVLKELSGTTGKRLVRGILGSLFKAR